MAQRVVGIDLMQETVEKASYVALGNDLLHGLSQWLAAADVNALLRLYSADGSYANIFVLSDRSSISDIKVEPRAAIRALVRDALELCRDIERAKVQDFVMQTVASHGLSGLLRSVD